LDSLPNILGWVIGILPGLALLIYIKSNSGEPWRFINFISGWLLIGVASIMIGVLTDWLPLFELLQKDGKISEGELENIKSSSAIWLAMFPAVFGGIGVNVISEWLLSKRPS
jgi:hypothetical protein